MSIVIQGDVFELIVTELDESESVLQSLDDLIDPLGYVERRLLLFNDVLAENELVLPLGQLEV